MPTKLKIIHKLKKEFLLKPIPIGIIKFHTLFLTGKCFKRNITLRIKILKMLK